MNHLKEIAFIAAIVLGGVGCSDDASTEGGVMERASDVVVIKINYQWSQCGGTNTDLLRGLMMFVCMIFDTIMPALGLPAETA